MNLYQITSPYFCAGLCVDAKGTVWEAAPIIKWMREKPITFVIDYCKNKKWDIKNV